MTPAGLEPAVAPRIVFTGLAIKSRFVKYGLSATLLLWKDVPVFSVARLLMPVLELLRA